jgi:hypothetical protein
VSGLGSSPVTVRLDSSTVSSASFNVSAPNAAITFSPTATAAVTSFDAGSNTWLTTVPSRLGGNTFLDGVALPVPNGLPGGINPVTWGGNFTTDTPGVTVNWQWAAAVYKQFSADNNALGVKPVDDNHASAYQNSDHAGTPEVYKAELVGGARGGGGSNWTGSYSATKSVAPDQAALPSSLSGFVNQVGGAPVVGMTVALSDAGGHIVATTTTALDGSYSFTGLGAGTYTVAVVPQAPAVVVSQAGTVNGNVDGTADGSQITGIALAAGQDGVEYDFLLGGQPQ